MEDYKLEGAIKFTLKHTQRNPHCECFGCPVRDRLRGGARKRVGRIREEAGAAGQRLVTWTPLWGDLEGARRPERMAVFVDGDSFAGGQGTAA